MLKRLCFLALGSFIFLGTVFNGLSDAPGYGNGLFPEPGVQEQFYKEALNLRKTVLFNKLGFAFPDVLFSQSVQDSLDFEERRFAEDVMFCANEEKNKDRILIIANMLKDILLNLKKDSSLYGFYLPQGFLNEEDKEFPGLDHGWYLFSEHSIESLEEKPGSPQEKMSVVNLESNISNIVNVFAKKTAGTAALAFVFMRDGNLKGFDNQCIWVVDRK